MISFSAGVCLYISICFDSSSANSSSLTYIVLVDHPWCFHTCQLDFIIKTKLFFSELADPMQVLMAKLHT